MCNNKHLEDGGNLLGGDGNIVIGEDEGGVDAGELGVGHVELSLFRKSPKKRGFNSEENKRIGLGKIRKRKKEDQNNE